MTTPKLIAVLLLVIGFATTNTAQNKLFNFQDKYFGLSKMQIKQLSTVQLIKGEKKFPESYLYGMKGDSLILLTDISEWNEKSLFAKSKISTAKYDELVVSSKADRRRKSVLWGTLIGAASFAIAQKASRTHNGERSVGKRVLGQAAHNGYIEGTIAGVTGFGIGMIIGQAVAKRKINLRTQKRKALRELREFSYK